MADVPPDLAPLIAAVQCALGVKDCNLGQEQHVIALRAAQAVLEGLTDHHWLERLLETISEICTSRADALLAALLARAGGGNG